MDNQKGFEDIYKEYKQQGQKRMKEEVSQIVGQGQEQVVAVRKNDEGDIIAIKTESGRELDYVTALEEAKAGRLAHLDVFHKYGRDILRSEPDGIKENNLDQLDTF